MDLSKIELTKKYLSWKERNQHRKDYPSKAIAKAIAKAKEGTSDSNTIKNENIRVTQGAGSDIQIVDNTHSNSHIICSWSKYLNFLLGLPGCYSTRLLRPLLPVTVELKNGDQRSDQPRRDERQHQGSHATTSRNAREEKSDIKSVNDHITWNEFESKFEQARITISDIYKNPPSNIQASQANKTSRTLKLRISKSNLLGYPKALEITTFSISGAHHLWVVSVKCFNHIFTLPHDTNIVANHGELVAGYTAVWPDYIAPLIGLLASEEYPANGSLGCTITGFTSTYLPKSIEDEDIAPI
ncbi:hypothetical protein CONCODRAFT_7372 [Conidiobolus coronatus NRRL 28638]|uniref:Uncharacterized protein n=1 Tax=Conidiobolus coronatus (strain ATCC 28846 / CBS 209.66 / NRRL 28638) TaxID=796925 RepID=A0A137P540_CONC2|nr:hypothetical protein CONCODRAFT_7372 [Conidiobolus coronatus NRRL 28638]|eukprot:KXN70130.1 hypothetical protein CONCODRAFT_7372 [Conidiobolus coronatus NRRL 28638]